MNIARWKNAWASEGDQLAHLSAVSELLDNERNHEPKSMDVYKMYGDFHCPGKKKQKCKGNWSSTECVSVWNYWYDPRVHQGQVVLVKEYQQQCRKCESWVSPHFDEESAGRAVSKLVTRIKRVFYGEAPASVHSDRHSKANVRKKPHDFQRCEACRDGICPQGDFGGFNRHRQHFERDYTGLPKKRLQWKIKLGQGKKDKVVIGDWQSTLTDQMRMVELV